MLLILKSWHYNTTFIVCMKSVANRSLKVLRLFANLFLNKYEWWTLCENSLKQYIAQISYFD